MKDRIAVDQELLGRLLLQLEANVHRGGWDAPAQLHVLYDARDERTGELFAHALAPLFGPPVRVAHYRAQPMIDPDMLVGHAEEHLGRLASNLVYARENPDAHKLRSLLRQPGVLGYALVAETWCRTYATVEEREADGDVQLADLPGSRESRIVVAVDVGGRVYQVERDRGSKPELADDTEASEGSVIAALRLMVEATVGDAVANPEPAREEVRPVVQRAARDAFMDRHREHIAEQGWSVTGVFPTEDHPCAPFAHTSGLTAHGFPELVIAGLSMDVMHRLLNDLASRVYDRAERYHHGQRISDLLHGFNAIIVEGPAIPELHPGSAYAMYGRHRVHLQQIVWPDKDGWYPWDDEYGLPGGSQPVLGSAAG